MELTLKEKIVRLIMLIIMILGVAVPVGIIIKQKRQIDSLQKQVEEFELKFYDDIFELMAEVYMIDSELVLKEQELEDYKKYMELLVDYEVTKQTLKVIEEYVEEILLMRNELLKAQHQLELVTINHAYELEEAYGFDMKQILDDWEATLWIMEDYYSQPQTVSYETYLYTNYPELYARIMEYDW